jgi:hypothetical protein
VGRGCVGFFYFGIKGGELYIKTLVIEIYAGMAVMQFPPETLVSSDEASTGNINL